MTRKKVMVEVDDVLWTKFRSTSSVAKTKLYDAAEEAFRDYIKKKVKEGAKLEP